MREGLLWFDASARRSQQLKLDDARARFAERFGFQPNCCHVHPTQYFEHPDVVVVADASVLPHHLLIGRDESIIPPAVAKRPGRVRAPTSARVPATPSRRRATV